MRKIALTLFLLFILIPNTWASVAGEVNKANDLYKKGKFDDSLDLYQKALDQDDKSPVVKYDLGTALYKKGDYAKALGYLEQAAQDKNIKIKPQAEYNLGNVLYKSGVQKENTNVDEAIKSLQKSLGYYGQAIADSPNDQDALFNQKFVKQEIERLKEKKQEQQQQKNQQNNQQKQQNQQQQEKDQKQQDQQGQQKQQDQQQQQENQQKKQDQQSQQNKQESQGQQKKQEDQQSSAGSQQQKEQKSRGQQSQESQKELDRREAEDLLEDYQENNEPKKLLNYMPKKIDDRPVTKDW